MKNEVIDLLKILKDVRVLGDTEKYKLILNSIEMTSRNIKFEMMDSDYGGQVLSKRGEEERNEFIEYLKNTIEIEIAENEKYRKTLIHSTTIDEYSKYLDIYFNYLAPMITLL